jgi:hypothetical protein
LNRAFVLDEAASGDKLSSGEVFPDFELHLAELFGRLDELDESA